MKEILKKNEEYVVDIIDNGYEGEGIAKIEDFTIFIPGAIKGEKVRILIVKVLTSYAYGKIIEIIQKVEARKQPDCSAYKRCGGCSLRHIKYEETLKIKQDIVQNLVNKNLKNNIQVEPTVGMKEPYHYRNKAIFPFGYDSTEKMQFGIYAKRSHEIIPIQECLIQTNIALEITKYIHKFMQENHIPAYNEKNKSGDLRHIVIKQGFKTGQIMCILVTKHKKFPKEKQLIQELTKQYPQIITIIKNINSNNTNVILGKENEILYGKGYIYDQLGEYTFQISPLSFYQVNPFQTQVLYNTAIQLADLNKKQTAFDLYCGIGTITLFIAKQVEKVYGIEIIPQAIEDAKQNAKQNQITNAEFIVGTVEQKLPELVKQENKTADVVFIDPPRKGCDETTIKTLLQIKPKKIIYISCNPSTLVRDLAKLQAEYQVKTIKPIDMFPFSNHVECVAVLQLKKDR